MRYIRSAMVVFSVVAVVSLVVFVVSCGGGGGTPPTPVSGSEGSIASPVNLGTVSTTVTYLGKVGAYDTSYYRFTTGSTSGSYDIGLTNTKSDLSWALFTDSGFNLSIYDCDNNVSPGANNETCSVMLTAGTTYYLAVDEWDTIAGTYTLSLMPPVDNSRASGTYSFVLMNGAMKVMIGTATFDGSGNGTYTVTSPLSSAQTGTFSYVAKVDNSLIIDGTSVGSLRNGGSFFTVVDVLAGEEQMMLGVKQSTLVTDVSTTYISGQFSYDANLNIAEANIIQINTATPSPGNLTFSALAGLITGTGTAPYTFDPTKGTISLPTPTTAADTFGAITSDRQLMILGDGETVSTPEVLGLVGLKQPGVAMSNASLNGTYLLYNIADENAGGNPFYVTSRARATFDGAGHGTFTELAKSSGTLVSKPSITYAVTANGGFSINGNGASELGTVIQDGSVFSMVYFDPVANYGSSAN